MPLAVEVFRWWHVPTQIRERLVYKGAGAVLGCSQALRKAAYHPCHGVRRRLQTTHVLAAPSPASRTARRGLGGARELPAGCLCLFDDTVVYRAQWDALHKSMYTCLQRPPC